MPPGIEDAIVLALWVLRAAGLGALLWLAALGARWWIDTFTDRVFDDAEQNQWR